MTTDSSASGLPLAAGLSAAEAPIARSPAAEGPAMGTLAAGSLAVGTSAAGTPAAGSPAAGFSDGVMQSQQTFRSALQALAHPGSVHDIDADCGVPTGLSRGMTAMLLTLTDVDTPVWLPADIDAAVPQFLRFHCGCPLVNEPMQARFVVVPRGCAAPDLAQCHPGDPAYPDTSTTLLLEVSALQADSQTGAPPFGAVDGHGQAVLRQAEGLVVDPDLEQIVLTGPGINGQRTLSVSGLAQDFWTQWRANHGLFPLGVDVFLIQGNRLCGLPRTVVAEG